MMYLKGVCCEFCKYLDTDECPVEAASPWSKWKDWCSHYEPDLEIKEARSIEQAVNVDLNGQLLSAQEEAWEADLARP